MSRKSSLALVILMISMMGTPLLAQDEEAPTTPPAKEPFKLSRDTGGEGANLDLDSESDVHWEPALPTGTIEVAITMGFMNISTTILQHDQIIYKYTTDATSWGDVKMTGESAFSPYLRLGYQINPWFALEVNGGTSNSTYTTEITNRKTRKNEPAAPVTENPPLGEFDSETRSLFTMQAALNAYIYPMSLLNGHSEGRWHPFVTGGVGYMWYDMNSNYTAKVADIPDFNFGLGVRYLVDKNISVRFDIGMHLNTLEFTPSEYFIELDEGTIKVPLNEYPEQPDGSIEEQQVTKYDSNDMKMFYWSLGVQGSF